MRKRQEEVGQRQSSSNKQKNTTEESGARSNGLESVQVRVEGQPTMTGVGDTLTSASNHRENDKAIEEKEQEVIEELDMSSKERLSSSAKS